jgi:pyruvate formate lyase activating enzyme
MAGRWVTEEQVLSEVVRDRIFFEESGGGVTFSGGEPLAQPGFLAACLEACRAEGLHTAVDTSGYGSGRWLARVADTVDLFLFDLKVLDESRHRRLTGVGNAVILENLRALNERGAAIWLRVPVIPGFNDDAASLESLRRLAASLGSVRKICLLPFHRHGLHKRKDPVEMEGESVRSLAPPSRDRLEDLAGPFRAAGLDTSIGG